MQTIIGISGKSCAGKKTLANFLAGMLDGFTVRDLTFTIPFVLGSNQNLIIPALHFPGEVDYVRDRTDYLVLVRLEAEQEIRKCRGACVKDTRIHDVALDGYPFFDFFIRNDGSLRDLYDESVDLAIEIVERVVKKEGKLSEV